MMRRPVQLRNERVAVLVAVLVLHAVLIAFFLLYSTIKAEAVKPTTTIALISIDTDQPAAAKPPPPATPAKVAKTFVPVTEISIPDEAQSDAPVGASTSCSTVELVRSALLLDADALNAVRNAPPDTRSIADAIVLWNVGWAPTALTPGDPLFVVRAAIERSLVSGPDNCLDEAVAGPRLIAIADASGLRTIFVVIGSGNWVWRELLSLSPLPGPDSAGPAPTPVPQAPPSPR